eukprot:gnl/TRDRNA2_/TRDRNA2_91296_c0_seq1.p1 gnl/TRDRNA2_/TRDRNA2_91296_c0~~gnl/TRDRNA2_/TRDRNA2_91296_c0_seq1.p1  ORF type:complete len:451 (+),score=62.92 gnl/TRDRNA2_/TRDRNA2_91296_c0_seq1:118-1470(+)
MTVPMMQRLICSATEIVLLAFVVPVDAAGLTPHSRGDLEHMVQSTVDKLLERSSRMQPHRDSQLESTTIGKTGHIASPGTRLSRLSLPRDWLRPLPDETSHGLSLRTTIAQSPNLAAAWHGRSPSFRSKVIAAASSREDRIAVERVKCESMRVSELKKELAELGIETTSFFEKDEFVRALAEARVDGVRAPSPSPPPAAPSPSPAASPAVEYVEAEYIPAGEDAGPKQASPSDGSRMGGMGNMGGMPVGGIPPGGMGGMGGAGGFQPGSSPFVAMPGASSPFSKWPLNLMAGSGCAVLIVGFLVLLLVMKVAGPVLIPLLLLTVIWRLIQDRNNPSFGGPRGVAGGMPFGGSPFGGPFGQAGGNPFGGVNSAGGAPGGNPYGAAGANPADIAEAMRKAQEMMQNPKVRELMMKAQSNPKVAECMRSPAAFAKYQNDPEVGELLRELRKYM